MLYKKIIYLFITRQSVSEAFIKTKSKKNYISGWFLNYEIKI